MCRALQNTDILHKLACLAAEAIPCVPHHHHSHFKTLKLRKGISPESDIPQVSRSELISKTLYFILLSPEEKTFSTYS